MLKSSNFQFIIRNYRVHNDEMGGSGMLIQVHYPDNRFDYVNAPMLNTLIESREILRFKRFSGWVTIGTDPLRGFRWNNNCEPYFNPMPVPPIKNLIRVVYKDFSFDYVADDVLEELIESNKIFKFQRSNGWVNVGLEPTRKSKREK
jgi:hypothetical protein